ncbi:hypothetical protein NP590_16100 [Methylomonas sp. SURF-2]|uniref:KTSC domain-containing protein n=1 Tax=Methylomonas subterranea TaxID=2952225 RepID=A0ABT1TJJ0_9GAMM|nr:hypothetical protein [Methylomonas sp. SURF-2]MCQ8105635.1 hypothetical protein [Methylomonas sp. SURF-2]
MKTYYQQHTEVAHAAFLDALSGEFIARTGCGAYVYLNPFDIHQMFKDYLKHGTPIRDYVKHYVKSFLSA